MKIILDWLTPHRRSIFTKGPALIFSVSAPAACSMYISLQFVTQTRQCCSSKRLCKRFKMAAATTALTSRSQLIRAVAAIYMQ